MPTGSQIPETGRSLSVATGSPPWSEKRKLEAISYRFYQQQSWGADQGRNGPAVGDYYCITRAGLALYRVSRIEEGRVWYASVYNDDGSVADGHEESFTHQDFIGGGFAYARCYCPPWCFLANELLSESMTNASTKDGPSGSRDKQPASL